MITHKIINNKIYQRFVVRHVVDEINIGSVRSDISPFQFVKQYAPDKLAEVYEMLIRAEVNAKDADTKIEVEYSQYQYHYLTSISFFVPSEFVTLFTLENDHGQLERFPV